MHEHVTPSASTPSPLLPELSAHGAALDRVRVNLNSVIRGKTETVEKILIALLARGHVLLADVPGIGKTTLARALAKSISARFNRIQFTSDLFPGDILGVNLYRKGREEFEFQPGPIFADIILADEINRATPKTQSALLEAMAERQVTLENKTHILSPIFMVLATQNPEEHYGTNPLPESQLDRFCIKLSLGYPGPEEEKYMLRDRMGGDPLERIHPVLQLSELRALQELVPRVHAEEAVLEYLVALVQKTRGHDRLQVGVSPRGSLDLLRVAQARAVLQGREYVVPGDIHALFVETQAHRVQPRQKYAASDRGALLEGVLDTVPVPA